MHSMKEIIQNYARLKFYYRRLHSLVEKDLETLDFGANKYRKVSSEMVVYDIKDIIDEDPILKYSDITKSWVKKLSKGNMLVISGPEKSYYIGKYDGRMEFIFNIKKFRFKLYFHEDGRFSIQREDETYVELDEDFPKSLWDLKDEHLVMIRLMV